MSFKYTVTLLCDSRASPDCRRSVEQTDRQPGTIESRNQLMGETRLAGWAFGRDDWDDIGLAVCPECLMLDPDAANAPTGIGRVTAPTEQSEPGDGGGADWY